MNDREFSVCVEEIEGIKVWEMEGIPQPNEVHDGIALYNGQGYVEQLMKVINQMAFSDGKGMLLDTLFDIFETGIEQGVEDVGTIQWDDQRFYTRMSWTGYSWKLPLEIKRRMVRIDISKVGGKGEVESMTTSLKNIAKVGGDIQLPPKMVSRLNIRNGNEVIIKMQFSS